MAATERPGGASAGTPAGATGEGERPIPTVVSPAWELEMLVSGAVLYALFQLPAVVNDLFDRTSVQLARGAFLVLFFAYWYAKIMIYTLMISFVVHLAARTYWVGLVGLDSVFPGGVRWEELKHGPTVRAVYRERLRALPLIIGRVDNFCSVTFSFAFVIVLIMAISVVGTAVLGGAVYGVSRLFFGGRYVRALFFGVVGVIVAIPLVTAAADKMLGPRLVPGGRGARLMRRLVVFTYHVQLVGVYGPILMTLFTNVRKRVIYPIFYVAVAGLLAVVAADQLVRSGLVHLGNSDYLLDESDRFGVRLRYYESERPEGQSYERAPSIQSDMIRDPYVRLFIPYVAERHDPAVARCPGVRPLAARGLHLGALALPGRDSAAAAVLRCLTVLHQVTLDGAPRPDVELRFYTHPRTGVRGLVAYLPTEGLAKGRHVLGVAQPPREPTSTPPRGPPPAPLQPWQIPFWL